MPQKKHKPEEIVAKLRQVDVLLSQGRSVGEAVRSIGYAEIAIRCNSPWQHGQVLSSMSTTILTRGSCAGGEPRLLRPASRVNRHLP